jgi:hypothetical protein
MNLYHVTAQVSVGSSFESIFDTVTVWANTETEAWMKSQIAGRRTRKRQKDFRVWIVSRIEQAK